MHYHIFYDSMPCIISWWKIRIIYNEKRKMACWILYWSVEILWTIVICCHAMLLFCSGQWKFFLPISLFSLNDFVVKLGGMESCSQKDMHILKYYIRWTHLISGGNIVAQIKSKGETNSKLRGDIFSPLSFYDCISCKHIFHLGEIFSSTEIFGTVHHSWNSNSISFTMTHLKWGYFFWGNFCWIAFGRITFNICI